MKNKGIMRPLAVAVISLALITPASGIDHPVEPFQKAKAMALIEGRLTGNGGNYILIIEGWGAIIYTAKDESIILTKGTPNDNAGVAYYGKDNKYHVSRRVDGGDPEIAIVDWSVAMDIANKYLQEIEAVRSK